MSARIGTKGLFSGLLLSLLLVGCGNLQSSQDRRADLGAWKLWGAKEPATLRLSAAAVAASPQPLVEVQTDTRKTVAVKVAEDFGTTSYMSGDGVTLGLREGVVVAVRGLHSDLMSSDVPAASRIASGQGSYSRGYQILNGVGQLEKLRFDCALSTRGTEEITVAERRFVAKVVAETCRNPRGKFENTYWIDSSGKIKQSHQWIGSGVDFLRLSFG